MVKREFIDYTKCMTTFSSGKSSALRLRHVLDRLEIPPRVFLALPTFLVVPGDARLLAGGKLVSPIPEQHPQHLAHLSLVLGALSGRKRSIDGLEKLVNSRREKEDVVEV